MQHEDTRPKRNQIAAALRAEIMAGVLAPGATLPPTHELVDRFDSSNATVQQALGILKAEGYLTSRRGAGVYVRDKVIQPVDIGAYFVPTPGGISYDILDVRLETPPTGVVKALGEDRAVLRKRLMRDGGEPVELNWAWYPWSIAVGTKLERPARMRGGAPRVLAEAGFPQRRLVDTISVRLPTPEEFVALQLSEDVPVINQFRVIYSDGDRPVEAAIMVKPGHLYSLRYPSVPLA